MSTLTLTVLHGPEHLSELRHRLPSGAATLGRSPECDWQLPDPAKSLSRRHCTFEFVSGQWQVRDLSANGTYVNDSHDPVGPEMPCQLHDGDRLLVGDYEVLVTIESRVAVQAPPVLPAAPGAGAGFGSARLPGLDDFPGSALDAHDEGAIGTPMADHSPSSGDAWLAREPQPDAAPPPRQLVPDNWWQQLDTGDSPFAEPPAAEPPERAPPAFFAPNDEVTGPRTANLRLPTSDGSDRPRHVPVPPALPAEPVHVPAALAHPPVAAVHPPAIPVHPPAPPLQGAADPGLGLAALLEGAEVPPELAGRALADPQAALRGSGHLLRAAVAGVRKLLISRGSVKREFRIEQTMLQSKANNPLKFAPSDDHALAMLLDPRTNALKAMQESIDDLSAHQVAVLAATQAAARALLDRLDPEAIEGETTAGGIMPGAREKRLWEAYRRRHAKLTEQFEDDFESAFGTAFARAYEQAVGKKSID